VEAEEKGGAKSGGNLVFNGSTLTK